MSATSPSRRCPAANELPHTMAGDATSCSSSSTSTSTTSSCCGRALGAEGRSQSKTFDGGFSASCPELTVSLSSLTNAMAARSREGTFALPAFRIASLSGRFYIGLLLDRLLDISRSSYVSSLRIDEDLDAAERRRLHQRGGAGRPGPKRDHVRQRHFFSTATAPPAALDLLAAVPSRTRASGATATSRRRCICPSGSTTSYTKRSLCAQHRRRHERGRLPVPMPLTFVPSHTPHPHIYRSSRSTRWRRLLRL